MGGTPDEQVDVFIREKSKMVQSELSVGPKVDTVHHTSSSTDIT